jgi:hypothetical protein
MTLDLCTKFADGDVQDENHSLQKAQNKEGGSALLFMISLLPLHNKKRSPGAKDTPTFKRCHTCKEAITGVKPFVKFKE